jgi:hypothetical protein
MGLRGTQLTGSISYTLVTWFGSIKSFDSKFSSGILASVNYDVCWLANYLNAILKPRKNKSRSCLLVCTIISCACVCVT